MVLQTVLEPVCSALQADANPSQLPEDRDKLVGRVGVEPTCAEARRFYRPLPYHMGLLPESS
jgi:hypothetical protein